MDKELYEQFITDYNNPNITAHDVRRTNKLNSRQYQVIRNIAVTNGDIPKIRHMNRTNAKFYTKRQDGTCDVSKQYRNGQKLYVGRFPNETTAKKVVSKCINHNWNLTEIQDWINDLKYKNRPKNYSLVNGYYIIQKSVNGENQIFGTIRADKVEEEVVEQVVDKFREYGWNKSYKNTIFDLFNI